MLTACKYAHHNFENYIAHVYRLNQVFQVYKGLFGELENEDCWPPYTTKYYVQIHKWKEQNIKMPNLRDVK